jgi:hypothetical protein
MGTHEFDMIRPSRNLDRLLGEIAATSSDLMEQRELASLVHESLDWRLWTQEISGVNRTNLRWRSSARQQ